MHMVTTDNISYTDKTLMSEVLKKLLKLLELGVCTLCFKGNLKPYLPLLWITRYVIIDLSHVY